MKAPRWLPAVALLVVGIGAGVILNRQSAPLPTPPAKSPVAPPTTPTIAPKVVPITVAILPAEFAALAEGANQPAFTQSLDHFVTRLTPDALATAAALSTKLPPPHNTNAYTLVLQRWAGLDSAAALTHAMAGEVPVKWDDIGALIRGWTTNDSPAVIAWARKVPPWKRYSVVKEICAASLATPPTNVIALAESLSLSFERSTAFDATFRAWADRDPAGAVKHMAGLETEDQQRRTLHDAFPKWARHDPDALVAWLKRMPESLHRRELVRKAAWALATTKPTAGGELIQALPPGEDRERVLVEFMGTWAEADAMAAFQWARALPDSAERTRIFERHPMALFVQANPDAVAEFFLTDPIGTRGTAGTLMWPSSGPWRIAAALANRSLADAEAWAGKLPAGLPRDAAWSAIVVSATTNQPAIAARLLPEIRDNVQRWRWQEKLMQQWVKTDAKAAADFASGRPDTAERTKAMTSVTAVWSHIDPKAAGEWLLTLPKGAVTAEVFQPLVAATIKQDPTLAARVLERMALGPEDSGLVGTLAGAWSKQNLDACAAWLEKLADPKLRDAGFRPLAQGIWNENPKRAAAFAENIIQGPAGDYPNWRVLIATKWSDTDPAAAALWAGRCVTNTAVGCFSDLISKWAKKDAAAATKFAFANRMKINSKSPDLIHAQDDALRAWRTKDRTAAENWLNATKLSKERKKRLLEAK